MDGMAFRNWGGGVEKEEEKTPLQKKVFDKTLRKLCVCIPS
jgi:hypothetical protein